MGRRIIIRHAIVVAMLATLSACTRGCASAPPPPPNVAVLRVQLGSEPVSLDPALAEDGLSLRVLANLMDGLVGHDASGALEARLAESWTVSSDGLRYEFRLRPGITWSDGRPVTSREFTAGIRRSMRPGSGSKLAYMLYPIRGGRDFLAHRSEELPGLRDEPGRVIFELEQPTTHFIETLTLPVAFPIREDVLEINRGRWPTTAPVTGPYRVLRHVPDQRIVLDQNPAYWRGLPPIRTVELVIVQDENTGANLFGNGKLDILTRIPGLELPRLAKGGLVHSDPFLATYYVSFNTRRPPFNDRQLRRAFAGAIRRDEITQLLATGDQPARSWIPPGLEGFLPWTSPAPVFADALTYARGKSARANPVLRAPIPTGFDGSARNSTILEKVQADVAEALGWKLALTHSDWKAYVKQLQTDPPAIYRFGWMAPFRDPVPHLQVFTSGNPNNYSGWSDPRYDALVAEIESLPPSAARAAKVREAQSLLVDREAAVVPLFHYEQNHAVAPRVKGFQVDPFGIIRFNELRLGPTEPARDARDPRTEPSP